MKIRLKCSLRQASKASVYAEKKSKRTGGLALLCACAKDGPVCYGYRIFA